MDYYGVEIVGKEAYTELVSNRTETAFGKQRNDFEGTKEECLKYLSQKNISEIHGPIKNEN